MTRTLILNGGASISSDLQSAYIDMDDPVGFFASRAINSGDILVYDSILGQTVHDQIVNLQFQQAKNPKNWPEGKFDQVIIRGSNYLRTGMDLSDVADFIETLDCPVIAMGVGAQAAKPQKIEMNAGTKRFWQAVADRCTSLGVRGTFSAEVFESIGVKNLKLIGCPSFYRCMEPVLRINKVGPAPRIGINLNQKLGGNYCSNAEKSNRMQRALIKQAANMPDSIVYGQGEVQESIAGYLPAEAQTEALLKILTKFELAQSNKAMEMYRARLVGFYNVTDWQKHIRQNIDFMVGFRLHGCAIALAQGIPGVLFTFDTRSREMAALFQIPSIEIEDFKPFSLEKIISNADFSKFEAAYRGNFITYRDFLDENDVGHRLSKKRAEHPEDPVWTLEQNLVDSGHSMAHNYKWLQKEMEILSRKHIRLRSKSARQADKP